MAPKGKEKPKPSASQPLTIEDHFTNLNRYIDSDNFVKVVETSDEVLKMAPGDEDAIICKIVGLIRADRIDEAFSTINEASRKFTTDFTFFKAYCLYRQNKLDEALELLKGLDRDSESMLLESQILYRQGKPDASVDIYQKLFKLKIDSLEVNVVAGLVSAGRSSEVQGMLEALKIKATNSFELAFNSACALIERNKCTEADQLLLSARRIGQENLMEESLAEDEIEIELAPIAVQLAYVQQLLGHTQEAVQSYTDIIKRNLADEASVAVAVNNLIALKGPKDISDSLRKLDRLIEKGGGPQNYELARGLGLKLSPKQREAIFINRVLLLLHSNKMDQVIYLKSCISSVYGYKLFRIILP